MAETFPEDSTNPSANPAEGAEIVTIGEHHLVAIKALDVVAKVIEVDASMMQLHELAGMPEPSDERLTARRALRVVKGFGKPDSKLALKITDEDMFHYAEAVIDFGASERTYLALMEAYRLTPQEVTGLYAVRAKVAENTDGTICGFPDLLEALYSVNISPAQAAFDPDEAVAALDTAGYFVYFGYGSEFANAVFAPGLAHLLPPPNIDSRWSKEQDLWIRQNFGFLYQPNPDDKVDDEEEH